MHMGSDSFASLILMPHLPATIIMPRSPLKTPIGVMVMAISRWKKPSGTKSYPNSNGIDRLLT